MENQRKTSGLGIAIWGLLGVVIVAIGIAFVLSEGRSKPPVPILSQVGSFSFTNQVGKILTNENLVGSVWVADVIFTRCAGPCPRLTTFMARLQEEFKERPAARFVSLTADPEYDTPEILRRYAAKYGASEGWHFLSGTERDIYDMVTKGLKLVAQDNQEGQVDPEGDLFVHSTQLVFVDDRGQVRGYVNALEQGAFERAKALMEQLLEEAE